MDRRIPLPRAVPDDHQKWTKVLHEQFANTGKDDGMTGVSRLFALLPGKKHPARSAEKIKRSSKYQESEKSELAATRTERGETVAFSVWVVSYINNRNMGLHISREP
jgi:hypothetical protein